MKLLCASRQALLSLYMSTQFDFYFYLLNHQNHNSQILPQKASQCVQHDICSQSQIKKPSTKELSKNKW